MDDIGERTYSRSAEKVDRRHFKLLSSLPYQRSNRHSTSPRFSRVTSVAPRLTTSYSAAAMLLNTATRTRKKAGIAPRSLQLEYSQLAHLDAEFIAIFQRTLATAEEFFQFNRA